MARKRVIFISGIGDLIPGQTGSIKDMKDYVSGAGGFFGGKKSLSQKGTLLNPFIGAASALLASTGVLNSVLSSLGVPQNIQNVFTSATNTGGLWVELYLNPQRITETSRKIIVKTPSASGFVHFHWGMDLPEFKFDIQTRSLRPAAKSAQQIASEIQKEMAISRTEINRNIARNKTAEFSEQNLQQLKKFFEVNLFNTGMVYENKIYVGHFMGDFRIERSIDMPNIKKASFTFVVDKIPRITLPGIGSFDLNQIPVSV